MARGRLGRRRKRRRGRSPGGFYRGLGVEKGIGFGEGASRSTAREDSVRGRESSARGRG
jgi:hypothetical protein